MRILTKVEALQLIRANKTKSYTYGLCRNDGSVYYIGVGIRGRAVGHILSYELKNGRNKLKNNTTKKELCLGSVGFVFYMFHIQRENCLKLEAKIIKHFGRLDDKTGTLTNLTSGGEIAATDKIISDETRCLLSQKAQARKPLTMKQQKEYWLNMSAQEQQIRVDNMRSKINTPEYLDALSKGQVKRWSDPALRQKQSEVTKVSQNLPEVRKQNSIRTKAMWDDPIKKEAFLTKCRATRAAKKLKV